MILIKISGPKLRGLVESYQSSVKIEKMFQAGLRPGPGVAGGCARCAAAHWTQSPHTWQPI